MSVAAAAQAETVPARRVLSIDLLRGLDVLLMLFVNEVAGVRDAPRFLLHVPREVDGMTITDLVFPAFLFIVGMAIPFALGGRLRRGESRRRVLRHVFVRTFALLVIGVLMANVERASPDGPLSPAAWNVLMTAAVILTWPAPAADAQGRRRQRVLRAAGIAAILVLALVYRGEGMDGAFQVRTHWWGILGLIGWGYLVAASLYLLVGDRPGALTGLVALLYCVYLADVAGEAAWLVVFRPVLHVGSDLGSHAAIVLAGTVLGVMLAQHRRERGSERRFVAQALLFCAGLAAAGLMLHELSELHRAFWIHKLGATMPWSLLSSAITGAVWVVLYAIVDLGGWRRFPPSVVIAGESALVAYLLAPFLLSLFALSAGLFGGVNPYAALGANTWIGLVRSAVFAWLVVRLCGLLQRSGVRMQL
jgi:predicted acyltransferase